MEKFWLLPLLIHFNQRALDKKRRKGFLDTFSKKPQGGGGSY